MAMQNHKPFVAPPGPTFCASAKIDLLGCKVFEAKASQITERIRPAKNKRAGGPLEEPRQAVPGVHYKPEVKGDSLHSQNGTTAHDLTPFDTIEDFPDQTSVRAAIRVDKYQPVTFGGPRTGISDPGDLMKGFKNHPSTVQGRQLGGAVVRVVVHHDELCGIPALGGGDQGLFNAFEGA